LAPPTATYCPVCGKALVPGKQNKAVRAASSKFKAEMESLGVGVRIKAGDGPGIAISEPPETEA